MDRTPPNLAEVKTLTEAHADAKKGGDDALAASIEKKIDIAAEKWDREDWEWFEKFARSGALRDPEGPAEA